MGRCFRPTCRFSHGDAGGVGGYGAPPGGGYGGGYGAPAGYGRAAFQQTLFACFGRTPGSWR